MWFFHWPIKKSKRLIRESIKGRQSSYKDIWLRRFFHCLTRFLLLKWKSICLRGRESGKLKSPSTLEVEIKSVACTTLKKHFKQIGLKINKFFSFVLNHRNLLFVVLPTTNVKSCAINQRNRTVQLPFFDRFYVHFHLHLMRSLFTCFFIFYFAFKLSASIRCKGEEENSNIYFYNIQKESRSKRSERRPTQSKNLSGSWRRKKKDLKLLGLKQFHKQVINVNNCFIKRINNNE